MYHISKSNPFPFRPLCGLPMNINLTIFRFSEYLEGKAEGLEPCPNCLRVIRIQWAIDEVHHLDQEST